MNKDTFYSYLQNPEQLGDESLRSLAELKNEYPFFQAAQLLYLKNLQNLENIRFNKQLKLTAAYMFDRRVLYQLLNIPVAQSPQEPPQERIPEPPQEHMPEYVPGPLPEEPIPEPLPEEPIPEPLPEPQPDPEPNPDPQQEEPAVEPVPEPTPGSPDQIQEDPIAPVLPASPIEPEPEDESPGQPIRVYKNQEIIGRPDEENHPEEPIGSSQSSDEISAEKMSGSSLEENQLRPSAHFNGDDRPVEQGRTESQVYKKSSYVSNLEQFIPIADIDMLMFDFPSGQDNDVLEFAFENRAPELQSDTGFYMAETENEEVDEPPISITSHDLIEQFLHADPLERKAKPMPEGIRQKEPQTNPPDGVRKNRQNQKQEDLLDAFIQNQPRITKGDEAGRVRQDDVSLESLKDDESFMTETLARIYLRQGYYYKAIRTYEKLSLKYPEKSIYFATQIEKIKELINNQ